MKIEHIFFAIALALLLIAGLYLYFNRNTEVVLQSIEPVEESELSKEKEAPYKIGPVGEFVKDLYDESQMKDLDK